LPDIPPWCRIHTVVRTPQQIRSAELPRALRGFDEEATRNLLDDAAGALATAIRERDDLQRRVEPLQRRVEELSAGAEAPETPTQAEAIGKVLLTANQLAEELVAKATDEAAAIRRDAETARDDLLARARSEAEELLGQALTEADARAATATRTVEALKEKEEALRRSIAKHHEELVAFLRGALAQLADFEQLNPGASDSAGLDDQLLSRVPSNSPSSTS
jgi:cell division septum initiation protein DivIVA